MIELLVVTAVIVILAAILFPVFTSAKEAGRRSRCAAHAKQLAQAIILYTDDNDGRYVPAAPDIEAANGGLRRWHGVRPDTVSDFDPRKGPLWAYLGRSGGLKICPSTLKLFVDRTADPEAFESGCGGYGYNAQYVGGTAYKYDESRRYTEASSVSDIRNPARTVMLADTAIAKAPRNKTPYLIEYSFAEPPYLPSPSSGVTSIEMSPTIHFRHTGTAEVVWCDGHVSIERMSFTTPKNIYRADNQSFLLGWFGPKDNSLFDNR